MVKTGKPYENIAKNSLSSLSNNVTEAIKELALNISDSSDQTINQNTIDMLVYGTVIRELSLDEEGKVSVRRIDPATFYKNTMSLQEFENKVKFHDWFFRFSDDNRKYLAGLKVEEEIIQEMSTDQHKEIYNKYNPFLNE